MRKPESGRGFGGVGCGYFGIIFPPRGDSGAILVSVGKSFLTERCVDYPRHPNPTIVSHIVATNYGRTVFEYGNKVACCLIRGKGAFGSVALSAIKISRINTRTILIDVVHRTIFEKGEVLLVNACLGLYRKVGVRRSYKCLGIILQEIL